MKTPRRLFIILSFLLSYSGGTLCAVVAQEKAAKASTLPARSFMGMGGTSTTPERRVSPAFAGNELPLPPQQKAGWSVPASSIPSNFLSATALLFEQGLADPRGCDYREIEIGTGDIWQGDGGVVKTRGWVLPAQEGQRFAVAWNGLVYPVVSTGLAADWREDARSAITNTARRWRSVLPEGYEISAETCLPIKGCLLLRLGEARLAEQMWLALQEAGQRERNPGQAPNVFPDPSPRLGDEDPYLGWASDWAWSLFERALCAHMRGDDGLSLASVRLLAGARSQIEKQAEQRGFKRRETFNSPWDGKYQDHVNFLGPLPALQADQERRARARTPLPALAEIAAMTNQATRISAWIHQLDQVAVRQWGQPGGLGPWETDPVVAGLIKEGEAAIEPLLECLTGECGTRLTRSVSFGRSFHRGRTLHPVSQPIAKLLLKLMNTSDAAVGIDRGARYSGDVSNAVLVASFRRFWRDLGKLSLSERWYRKLADDRAGEAAWADALANIVRAEKVKGRTNETVLAGEALRTRQSPSVTELLVRRAGTIAQGASHAFDHSRAVGFLSLAEKWEARPFVPIAAGLQEKIMAAYKGEMNIGSADPLSGAAIASLASLRARHEDTAGLDAYAAWVEKTKPEVLNDSTLEVLEPFWQFPNHPSIRTAAQSMFGNTNSPWGTLAWVIDARGHWAWRKPLASPLLVIPQVRALVINELASHAAAGEAVYHGGGDVKVNYLGGRQEGYGARKDTEGLEAGTKSPFRRCDVVVEQLAGIGGFPPISLLWPEPKRDEAVAAATRLLTQSGSRLRAKEKKPGWSAAFDPPLVELVEEGK